MGNPTTNPPKPANPGRRVKGPYAVHTNDNLCLKILSRTGSVDDYVNLIMDLAYTTPSAINPPTLDNVPGGSNNVPTIRAILHAQFIKICPLWDFAKPVDYSLLSLAISETLTLALLHLPIDSLLRYKYFKRSREETYRA